METQSKKDSRRVLTIIPVTAIVISSMIGTGIFTTTGLMASLGASAGDILVAWLIGGIIALCGALCYGEIGAALPQSGGEYYYLSRLLHPALGFMAGCVSIIVGFAAPVAASAMAMHLFFGRVVSGWPVRLMAVITILIVSLLHLYDVRLGSKVQTLLIATKVMLMLTFIASLLFGGWSGSLSFASSFNPSFWLSSSFAVVLVFISFAYSGWNAAAYIGAEVIKPERTLPRSLLLGTTVVIALYLLVNLSYLSAMPVGELAGVAEVAHVVGEKRFGPWGGRLISAAIALTQIVPISVMIMIGPRVLERMARDGFMPSPFAKLSRRNIPVRAVLLQAALASLIALTSSFGPLLIFIGFTLNLFALLTVCCLFKVRRAAQSPSRICFGYPVTPIIFIAFSLWSIIWSIRSQPAAAFAGFGVLAIGYLAFLWSARGNKKAKETELSLAQDMPLPAQAHSE